MSEPKFMHGPWHFAGAGIIANDDDEEIGLSAVYDDDPNGKLIIAAPDLYSAVKRVDALLRDLEDVYLAMPHAKRPRWFVGVQDMILVTSNALAKVMP